MDAYDLQARHAPVVFSALPIMLVALALVPGLGEAKLQAGSIGLLLLVALGFVATRLARAAGRARQDQLFASWDGMPTTAMLRFRDTRLNPQTKKIYRDRLSHLGAQYPIPDEEEERRDPAGADIKIGAAIGEVRERAKRKAIKAVHRENINYGAARNAYGLKPFGLGACLIAAAALTLAIVLRAQVIPTALDITVGMAIVVIAGTWLLACTAERVRHHGEAYALALYEAIVEVVPATRAGRKKNDK
jgi:hypothetical protein